MLFQLVFQNGLTVYLIVVYLIYYHIAYTVYALLSDFKILVEKTLFQRFKIM